MCGLSVTPLQTFKIELSSKKISAESWHPMDPILTNDSNLSLARTPEIGQGLGRILSCGARKPEQT